MRIVYETGCESIAKVYVAELARGFVEFCESAPEAGGIAHKWVAIVSTLFGCPVRCGFCDAGIQYRGRLSAEEILAQVRYLIDRRFGQANPATKKLKVQFARMGEPSFNPAVLEALQALPEVTRHPSTIACLSTVAPRGRDAFFDGLRSVKTARFAGRFQLQFSLHTTDEAARDRLIPISKWSFREIATYGERFRTAGDKKVTLSFAGAREIPVEPAKVAERFDRDVFLIKLTPINPTRRAAENGLTINDLDYLRALRDAFEREGFETLLSIGNLEENEIGSNCGQYLERATLPRPRSSPGCAAPRSQP